MASLPQHSLKPRKQPRQGRSQVTVDAIFEATIQVLLRVGPTRVTTTQIAERAGVSVGTLYQYYPNKQALLYAVLQRHLARVGSAVEAAALSAKGLPLQDMVGQVIDAFLEAKIARLDEARALYSVASGLDVVDLVKAVSQRGVAAVAAMLATASDA